MNLQVASGRLVVPQNLVGMSLDDAKKALTSAGFTVITINQQTTTQQDQNGKVLSVNPAAGNTVDSGAEVTLTVGQYSAPPTQSPTASPSPTTVTAMGIITVTVMAMRRSFLTLVSRVTTTKL